MRKDSSSIRALIGGHCLVLLLGLAAWSGPQERIYIANDDHTDYFWTADEATYRESFVRMIDYYVERAAATSGKPDNEQARFVCDGCLWMWEYERARSAEAFETFMDRVRDGHITVPLNALSLSQGGAPAEAVLRGMYYPGRVERRYPGVRFLMAFSIENPTYPLGIGSLWAGSGAKYSWAGNWGGDTLIPRSELSNRGREIYWWVGRDGTRLLIKWNSLVDGAAMGGYAEARNPAGIVDYLTQSATYDSRWPYPLVKGAFGKGWDDLQTLTTEFETVARERTELPGRKVVVSNEVDFFKDFEATYGDRIPSYTASFGNEWDLHPASIAEVTARLKRAVEKLRAAEAMACLVSLRQPGFMNGRAAARDLAFMDLGLYWEHDFNMYRKGSAEVAKRLAFQRRLVGEIESYVDSLYADAAKTLGEVISGGGEETRFYAFNPLSWQRTEVADVSYDGPLPVHVVDLAAGTETPFQVVEVDGARRLRIEAQGVPPLGYKVFEIRSGKGKDFDSPFVVDPATGKLENEFYRLTVRGSGALANLVDSKQGGREFVRAIDGRAANDLGSTGGSLTLENAGPVSATLKAVAADGLAHTTRVTLYRSVPRIDLENVITEGFDAAATWAFGFDLPGPDVWHEECGAVLRARRLADGGHYAPKCARVDWLTLNHFAHIGGGGAGVTLANADCLFFKLGRSTPGELDTATPQIQVLAGGRVGGQLGSNIRNQGGDERFLQRFALKTTDGAFRADAAMRFGLEQQNPLVTGPVRGTRPEYPENEFSFASLTGDAVLVWALKPPEDGIQKGIIARLWNLSDSRAEVSLMLAPGIQRATRTTHIETPVQAATVSAGRLQTSLGGQEMQTFLLEPVEVAVPTLYDISPSAAAPGDRIALTGINLGRATQVLFGDVAVSDISVQEDSGLFHVTAAIPRSLPKGIYWISVRSSDGGASNAVELSVEDVFVRGDVDLNRSVDVADAVRGLWILFLGLATACPDALDADDSGTLEVTDVIALLRYLFQAGAPPSSPFPAAGGDPTADALGCVTAS